MSINPVEFCRELVRIPSLGGREGAAVEWAAARMDQLGFSDIEQDCYGSVTGIWQGEKPGPTLFFDCHLDVVPVTEPDLWRHPPFEAALEDGKIWGRGAADTKASLAAMLAGVASLPRTGLRGRVVLAATIHEETLTGAAVMPLIKRFKPDVFITGEPTSLNLATSQKGRVTIELRTHGRSAHTSQPELGENAVYRMIDAVQHLPDLPKKTAPLLGREVLELTEIISEPFPNGTLVPHGCRVRMIGRILPGETRQGYLERVKSGLKDIPGVEVGIARLSESCWTGVVLENEDFLPGWRNPPDDPWVRKILAALAEEGLPANVVASGCGTNASAAGVLGIPAFIYGPGDLKQAHIVDEWVSVEELEQGVGGFRAIALACLGG